MMTNLCIFFAAWVLANISIECLKGWIRRRQAQKMVDEVYLKFSKLVISVIKDGVKDGR